MIDGLLIVVLLFVVVLALLRFRNHFRGGGCCGSGSRTIRTRKKLTEPAIGEKVLTIEGMHCENCQARVENAIDRLDGVVCQVNLRKKAAHVAYSRPVSDEELRAIVERLGYSVTAIQ